MLLHKEHIRTDSVTSSLSMYESDKSRSFLAMSSSDWMVLVVADDLMVEANWLVLVADWLVVVADDDSLNFLAVMYLPGGNCKGMSAGIAFFGCHGCGCSWCGCSWFS